jgi:hypothetical protein
MVSILEFGDLITAGDYTIQTRFKNHINFISWGKLLTLTDKPEDAGPLNLVLNNLDFTIPQKLSVRQDSILLNKQYIPFPKVVKYRSNLKLTSAELDRILTALPYIYEFVLAKGSESSLKYILNLKGNSPSGAFQRVLLNTIDKGFKILLEGELSKGVQNIKGRGLGLTPSGDDLLTGMLYGLHLLQFKGYDLSRLRRIIYESSHTDNLISWNYLTLAYQGSYFADLKRLLTALISENKREKEYYLELYLNKGETSGSDLMTGLILTLKNKEKMIELNK